MEKELESQIKFFLGLILEAIDPDYTLDIVPEADQWRIVINSSKVNYIIGEQGSVLSAIQHIVRTLVHKNNPKDKTHFLLDVGTYRKNREEVILVKVSSSVEDIVLKRGKSIVLTGLSSYERLLVHKNLTDIKNIQSMSVGPSNGRKVVIMPTSESTSGGMDNSIIIDFTSELDRE
jgi:predicted RNA-binding protein Jag